MPSVFMEEPPHVLRPLKPGHITVEVETVDAVDVERHMVTKYSFDVRHIGPRQTDSAEQRAAWGEILTPLVLSRVRALELMEW